MVQNVQTRLTPRPNIRQITNKDKVWVRRPPIAVTPVPNVPNESAIQLAANRFIQIMSQPDPKLGNAQDAAHDVILAELLKTRFAPQNLKPTDPINAIEAVRNNIQAPLYQIRQSEQSTNDKGSIFIRDYIQIQANGVSVVKQDINDGKASVFAKEFDNAIAKVNNVINIKAPHIQERVWRFAEMAHRDGIQAVPPVNYNLFTSPTQFAAAKSTGLIIQDNIIQSSGGLQGIFATDGLFEQLIITGNKLQPQADNRHTITINGMMSGNISNNTDLAGNLLPASKVKLLPLRIGGDANIYIVGFSNASKIKGYDYRNDIVGLHQATDQRRSTSAKSYAGLTSNSSFYTNFDVTEFQRRFGIIRSQKAKNPDPKKRGITRKDYIDIMAALVKSGHAKVAPKSP